MLTARFVVFEGLELYGDEERCKEKGIEFKSRFWLVIGLIEGRTFEAKGIVWLWDFWYVCGGMVQECRLQGLIGLVRLRAADYSFMRSNVFV